MIADHRTTEVGGQVAIPVAFVPALGCRWRSHALEERLARQGRRLRVVRRGGKESAASLPGDDIDHSALNVAEFSGRADSLDPYFLNEIDSRLGPRDPVTGASEVRAVN